MKKELEALVDIISDVDVDISFTFIEVGALQIPEGNQNVDNEPFDNEPFYELLKYYPSSRVIGFELDEDTCDSMNLSAGAGIKYYPHALGKANEVRSLYITQHPMCCSLYKPNDAFISLYQEMQYSYLVSETTVDTISLDFFLEKHKIGPVDFIKIDVQGAELDVFKGGKEALENVLKIVCEVEFVPMYKSQPLFGDICNFLDEYSLMFNKFLGMCGRTLKPILMGNNPNHISQVLWTDAVFVRHVQTVSTLDDLKLLKLSLLSEVYDSSDLTCFYLSEYDRRHDTQLTDRFLKKLTTLT